MKRCRYTDLMPMHNMKQLPEPNEPKIHEAHVVAGACLERHLRGFPILGGPGHAPQKK